MKIWISKKQAQEIMEFTLKKCNYKIQKGELIESIMLLSNSVIIDSKLGFIKEDST